MKNRLLAEKTKKNKKKENIKQERIKKLIQKENINLIFIHEI